MTATKRIRAVAGQSVRRAATVIALTFVAIAILACSSVSESEKAAIEAADSSAAGARTGEEIFAATCAACHGASGEGQPNWHIPKADGRCLSRH